MENWESVECVPGLEECSLSLRLDLCNPLHSLYRSIDQISVVSDWYMSSLLECQCRIDCHLLSSCLSERLGPLELSRVSLHPDSGGLRLLEERKGEEVEVEVKRGSGKEGRVDREGIENR